MRLSVLLVLMLCAALVVVASAQVNPQASSQDKAVIRQTYATPGGTAASRREVAGTESDLEHAFPTCKTDIGHLKASPIHSYYVQMRDGVRIALDVVIPEGTSSKRRFPTVLIMTRYWRSAEGGPLTDEEKTLASNGFAIVTGDVRGTGASFGIWPYHRSRAETLDFGEIIHWIAEQAWSDGSVAGYGLSYSANTADWMAERNNPALKAIAPRFPDYDPYADLYFPGGVPNVWMAETWGLSVKEMDLNQMHAPNGNVLPGVRPVDGDMDKRLLAQAIEERRNVPSVWEGLKQIIYRDDRPTTWAGASMDDWGIYSVREKVERSQTPIQTWGSWFDAGTANGVLHRFMTQSNQQRAFIGAWPHGGFVSASPYSPRGTPASPPSGMQQSEDICFFDHFVNSKDPTLLRPRKLLAYYTMGEERWKTATQWPLPQARAEAWFFGGQNALGRHKPSHQFVADKYNVNFAATTGATNRWHTNGGVAEVWYGDRASEDRKLLTYTSQPLARDVEITGQPIADLYIASDRTDGNFFLYLEDVDRDGVVRYITEGELRGIDRKVTSAHPLYRVIGPYHSFRREDQLPLKPREITELQFSLMPVSVLISAGHRIRVALAGADADTFKRIPDTGDETYIVHRDRRNPSHIVLPIIPVATASRPAKGR